MPRGETSDRPDLVRSGVVGLSTGEVYSLLTPAPKTSGDQGREESSGMYGTGIVFRDDMPTLEELLRRSAVAYTILETSQPRGSRRIARGVIWLSLVGLGLLWGLLTAFSFLQSGYWLQPATAVFGCLATVVLSVTVFAHEQKALRD